MNRFVLSAKSLISVSWLVRSALILFAIISLFFAAKGQAHGVVILFFCLLPGAGYTSRLYLRSERRRLVPGMNEYCAAASIAFLVVAWAICSLLLVSLHGYSPEKIGGCFCGLAFALWVGTFDPIATPLMLLPYLVPMVAVAYQNETNKLFKSYVALPSYVHTATGVFFFVAGVAIVARYWFIITSKYSPFVYQGSANKKSFNPYVAVGIGVAVVLVFAMPGLDLLSNFGQRRSLAEWGEAVGSCGLHTVIAFGICGLLYVLWRGLIQYFSPTSRSLIELGHYLFGMSSANTWKMLPLMIGGAFLISFAMTRLIEGTQTDEVIHKKMGFILLLPLFAVTSVVLHGIPKLFSKLWLTGVSDDRNKTAKTLLLTLLARTLPATLLAIAVTLTMAMATTVGFVPALIACLLSTVLGSVSIWGIVKMYPLIVRYSGFFILTVLMIACVLTFSVVSVANEMILNIDQLTESVSPWLCVLGATALTTGVSILCIWDAARSIGASGELMETSDPFVIMQPQ